MQRSLESFFTKRTEVLKTTPQLLAEKSKSPDSLKRTLEEPLLKTPAKRIKPDSLTSLTCSFNSKASTSDGKTSKSISHDNLAPITLKLDSDTEFDFPWFTLPEHIKDSKQRRPDHPNYFHTSWREIHSLHGSVLGNQIYALG